MEMGNVHEKNGLAPSEAKYVYQGPVVPQQTPDRAGRSIKGRLYGYRYVRDRSSISVS